MAFITEARSENERKRLRTRVREQALADLLVTKIREYDKNFKASDLSAAIDWSSSHLRSQRKSIISDELAEVRLNIALKLVDLTSADRDTVLASILYTSLRVAPRQPVDKEALEDIGIRFGERVMRLVSDTLRLDALELLPLGKNATQDPAEQKRLFLLMCLQMTNEKPVFAIRGTANLFILDHIHENGTREQKEHYTRVVDDALAPLTYLAGYDRLYTALRDKSFLVHDPTEYISTKKFLDSSGFDPEEVKRQVLRLLIIKHRVVGEEFLIIEANKKGAASANAKARRKNQNVVQLGDRDRFRVIVRPHITLKNGEILTIEEATGGKSKEDIVADIYRVLSREIGRGNKTDPEIRNAFDQLRFRDADRSGGISPETIAFFMAFAPDQLKPTLRPNGKIRFPSARDVRERQRQIEKYNGTLAYLSCFVFDGRFDDYYSNPKPDSDYLAKQDTGFLRNKTGKLIEIEFQVVDYESHIRNTFDEITGHMYYKTGLQFYSDIVGDWRRASEETARGGTPSPSSHVCLYLSGNEIHHGFIRPGHQAYTVAELAEDLKLGSENGRRRIVAALVDNDDPVITADRFEPRRPSGTLISRDGHLKPGDRVRKLIDASGQNWILGAT